MKPLIRWAGSKRSIVQRLARYWPSDAERYVEPFAGSACLFFELNPPHAVLADLNDELIKTYRAVRSDPDLVIACLRRLPKGRQGYYSVRQQSPRMLSDCEVAARFLYLNRNCFNGLYRTNRSGEFNVPYGPPKKTVKDFEQRIVDTSLALRTAEILEADFEDTLYSVQCGDFVYLDPPYAVSSRRVFAEYLPNSFGVADLARLCSALDAIDRVGAKFVLNYADSGDARRFFRKWNPTRIWTRRNIAGFAGARRGTYELIATNFEPAQS